MGVQGMLQQAQALLQQLRILQPGDAEAFPMINESTRLSELQGRGAAADWLVPSHFAKQRPMRCVFFSMCES
jgi:hypothetical protein